MRTREILTSLVCLACYAGGASVAPPDNAHRVLFIGNSLTYTNNLPRTFADLTTLNGTSYEVQSVAKPNVALIDFFHDDGSALSLIAQGGWEFVVMQQGPTWPGLCGDTLTLAANMFSERIRAKNGKPALLMTWPNTQDSAYFEGVYTAYYSAANASSSLFVPGGEAWRVAWGLSPALGLYGGDGYHPSPLGTWLTAVVLYESLTGHDARGLPHRVVVDGVQITVDDSVITLLLNAAHAAAAPNARLMAPRAGASITC